MGAKKFNQAPGAHEALVEVGFEHQMGSDFYTFEGHEVMLLIDGLAAESIESAIEALGMHTFSPLSGPKQKRAAQRLAQRLMEKLNK